MMFTNHSHYPVHISRGQHLGEADIVSCGARMAHTGQYVDWRDLLMPSKGSSTYRDDGRGTNPPKTFRNEMTHEDLLTFNSHGHEIEKPP